MKIGNIIRMFLCLTVLTGVIYPLIITAIAQLTMSHKANGAIIVSEQGPIGAPLIAQKFESDKYFWPRPSFVNYNPLPSGGSNLGPTSSVLRKTVMERQEKISKAHGVDKDKIPPELLFASGSGLDPHIKITTAYFQMPRIAKSRGLEESKVKHLVDQMIINRRLGFLGEECINVFLLNKMLDEQ